MEKRAWKQRTLSSCLRRALLLLWESRGNVEIKFYFIFNRLQLLLCTFHFPMAAVEEVVLCTASTTQPHHGYQKKKVQLRPHLSLQLPFSIQHPSTLYSLKLITHLSETREFLTLDRVKTGSDGSGECRKGKFKSALMLIWWMESWNKTWFECARLPLELIILQFLAAAVVLTILFLSHRASDDIVAMMKEITASRRKCWDDFCV